MVLEKLSIVVIRKNVRVLLWFHTFFFKHQHNMEPTCARHKISVSPQRGMCTKKSVCRDRYIERSGGTNLTKNMARFVKL